MDVTEAFFEMVELAQQLSTPSAYGQVGLPFTAPVEQPAILSADIREFFTGL